MKKSQLKNIIRESVKELMTEQVNDMHQSIQMEICDCQPSTASSCQTLIPNLNGHNVNRGHTCNGQMCQQSDIGNIFTYTGNFGAGNINFTSITFKLTGISQPAPISWNPPFDMVSSSCPSNPKECCKWCQSGPPYTGNPPQGCKDWMCGDYNWIMNNCCNRR